MNITYRCCCGASFIFSDQAIRESPPEYIEKLINDWNNKHSKCRPYQDNWHRKYGDRGPIFSDFKGK